MESYAKVFIREKQESRTVRIGSRLKPELSDEVIAKWQSLLDLIVKIIGVPSGLIMKLNEDTIEVFLSSNSKGNPYKKGEKEKLVYGLYCETVIGSQDKLHIPDARKNPVWNENNPDVKINMISYLGYPVNWPDGEVFGTICILDKEENLFNDTFNELLMKVKGYLETDLKSLLLEQHLEEINKELQQALMVKDKFFSIIAHDLISPFNSLLGFSQLLQDMINSKDYDGANECTRMIRQSSERAMNLVVNLLEWSRAQTGSMRFNPVRIELADFIEDIISGFDDLASQKSITIIRSLPNIKTVYADKQMVGSILRNLISNAIKFTKQGGEITVRAMQTPDKVVVSVKDNGVGIPKESLEKLFRIDQSESTPGTGNEKGTGLGLILCKEFVEKHGGKIWVESEENKGTVFSFSLPVKSTT